MMLRNLVLALVLANVLVWAWGEGLLRELGLSGPVLQAEPERVTRQVRPELVALDITVDGETAQAAGVEPATEAQDSRDVEVIKVNEVAESVARVEDSGDESAAAPMEPEGVAGEGQAVDASTESEPEPEAEPEPEDVEGDQAVAAPAPVGEVRCLRMGPFEASELADLRAEAAALPVGSWQIDTAELGDRWMAYLGPLPSADAVRVRRQELVARGVDVDRPGEALEPGLSLGRYSTEEAAERAVAEFARQGVADTRVVLERPGRSIHALHLPEADTVLRRRVEALGRTMDKGLRDCD